MKLSFLSLLVLIVGFFNATEAHAKSGKKISRADLKYIADIFQMGKSGITDKAQSQGFYREAINISILVRQSIGFIN